MIELVFTVCLLASPERCDERHLTYAETMTPMACLMRGQAQLATWNEANPKWQITRWKCRPVRTAIRDA